MSYYDVTEAESKQVTGNKQPLESQRKEKPAVILQGFHAV